jgi:hypothetical protein
MAGVHGTVIQQNVDEEEEDDIDTTASMTGRTEEFKCRKRKAEARKERVQEPRGGR